nr:MAG TPA: hypothetical protein [Caudoviricetes sp.]
MILIIVVSTAIIVKAMNIAERVDSRFTVVNLYFLFKTLTTHMTLVAIQVLATITEHLYQELNSSLIGAVLYIIRMHTNAISINKIEPMP